MRGATLQDAVEQRYWSAWYREELLWWARYWIVVHNVALIHSLKRSYSTTSVGSDWEQTMCSQG